MLVWTRSVFSCVFLFHSPLIQMETDLPAHSLVVLPFHSPSPVHMICGRPLDLAQIALSEIEQRVDLKDTQFFTVLTLFQNEYKAVDPQRTPRLPRATGPEMTKYGDVHLRSVHPALVRIFRLVFVCLRERGTHGERRPRLV